jgi:hypothetical protein
MFVSKDKQELLEALRLVLQGKNVDTATESDSQKTTRKVVDNRDVKVENVDVKNENEDHSDTEEAKRNKMP